MLVSEGGRSSLLASFLVRIGNFSLDTFDSRLIFQKTVYLLQAFGFYLGYRFSWYIRGPYSPGLTSDGFKIHENLSQYPPFKTQNLETERRFEQFLEFIDPHKDDVLWLEVAASAHFLARVHMESDDEKILQSIKAKQPRVTTTIFDETLAELQKVGIL